MFAENNLNIDHNSNDNTYSLGLVRDPRTVLYNLKRKLKNDKHYLINYLLNDKQKFSAIKYNLVNQPLIITNIIYSLLLSSTMTSEKILLSITKCKLAKFILLLLFSTIIVEPLNATPMRRMLSGRHKSNSTKYFERFYPYPSFALHKPSLPKSNSQHHLDYREVGRINCTMIKKNLAIYEGYFQHNEDVFLKVMHNLTPENVFCLKEATLCYKPKSGLTDARIQKTSCNNNYGTMPVVCRKPIPNYNLEALLGDFLNDMENVIKMRENHEMSGFTNYDGQVYQDYKMQTGRLLAWLHTLPFNKKNLDNNNATYNTPEHTKAYTLYITIWNLIQRYQDLINQICPS